MKSHVQIALITCCAFAQQAFFSARAETQSVTFDAALTNATDWTYSEGFTFSSTHRAYGFTSKDARVTSPAFNSIVTSLVVRAWKSTDSTDRNLLVAPVVDGKRVSDSALVREIPVTGECGFYRVSWSVDDQVRRLEFYMTGKSGCAYLQSATLDFQPRVSPPANLRVVRIQANSVRLSFDNSAETVSNRIEIAHVVTTAETGDILFNCDFAGLSQSVGGNPQRCEVTLRALYPSLSGEWLYTPPESAGVLQISNGTTKGLLVHEGFADAQGLSVEVRMCRHPTDGTCREYSVGFISEGETNEVATFALDDEYRTFRADFPTMPSRSPLIVWNAEGSKSGRRAYLNRLRFWRNYAAAETVTNALRTVTVPRGDAVCVGGLLAESDYVLTLTALDAEGHASIRSSPLAFRTARITRTLLVVR